MTVGHTRLLVIFGILIFSHPSFAEYLIYLKGGHYIVADNCTFSSRQIIDKGTEQSAGPDQESVLVNDCAKGKPEGRIFWSTINGKFGEIDANNVYAIYGSKDLGSIRPPRATMPFEDYLITNRGESFVNARTYEEKDTTVHGVKRDELAKIDRRGVTGIDPEGERSRSGEGLCPGEPAEFAITDTELVGTNLVGAVTNLSKTAWKPTFDVEVREKGRFKGKFPVGKSSVTELSVIAPDETTTFDEPVPTRFQKFVERLRDPEAGVRLCFRKVKTAVGSSVAGQPRTPQPPAR